MPQKRNEQINLEGLARLAKLDLPEASRRSLEEDVQKIIAYFELLGELDTNPDDTVTLAEYHHCPLREDEPHLGKATAHEIRDAAPELKDEHFSVASVITRKT